MGKYTYEQSWEMVQKENPKLNIKEYINSSSSLVIQTWIANELAEGNRLKRIEILYSNAEQMSNLIKNGIAIKDELSDKV